MVRLVWEWCVGHGVPGDRVVCSQLLLVCQVWGYWLLLCIWYFETEAANGWLYSHAPRLGDLPWPERVGGDVTHKSSY